MKAGKNILLILVSLLFGVIITGASVPGLQCDFDFDNALFSIENHGTTSAGDMSDCCVNDDIHLSMATQVFYTPVKIQTPDKSVVELPDILNPITVGVNEQYSTFHNLSNVRILADADIHLLTGVFRL